MNSKTDKGIVYIATGDKFIKEATLSAKSVKKHMPEVSITLMTDKILDINLFDNIIEIEKPRNDFGDQVFHMKRTPYKKTIFLDSDIYLDDTIEDLFEILNDFDLAACHNQTNYSSERIDIPEINNIPACFPEYNSGVVAFNKNDKVINFLSQWENYYNKVLKKGQIHNQAAFRSALYYSDLRIATLPQEYNCVIRRPGCVNGRVKVFHGRLMGISSPGASMSVDVKKAAEVLNRSEKLRIYHNIGNEIEIVEPGLFKKLIFKLRNYGLIITIKKLIKSLTN